MAFSMKSGSTWKQLKSSNVKVSGTWRKTKEIYTKVNGVWRIVWKAITWILYDKPDYTDLTGLAHSSIPIRDRWVPNPSEQDQGAKWVGAMSTGVKTFDRPIRIKTVETRALFIRQEPSVWQCDWSSTYEFRDAKTQQWFSVVVSHDQTANFLAVEIPADKQLIQVDAYNFSCGFYSTHASPHSTGGHMRVRTWWEGVEA